MNLAILGTRGIPASYGGYETFAEELAVRLVQRGHSVTVFCEKGQPYTASSYKGVRLEYVAAPALGPLSIVWFDTHCMLKAGGSYDCVYLLGYGAGSFAWVTRLFGRPIWTNMDGLEWKRSKWPWYGRAYLRLNEWCAARFSSGVIADADGMETYLRETYGPKINCAMIPYGASLIETPPDQGLLSGYGVSPGQYYIVVCRLEPENHVREIIEGFGRSSTDRELIVVGNSDADNPYVRGLKQAAGPRVRFVGTCYEKEKLTALRYFAFAYIHGHSVGGTNPSLLEAMGCGNAVIAHENPFNREVAADAALYFSSAAAIPDLVRSLETGDGRLRLGAVGRERIRTIYNWELITDQYESLFGRVLSKGG